MQPKLVDFGNPVADHPHNRGLDLWALPLRTNSGGTRLFDLGGRWPGTLTNGPTWTSGPQASHQAIKFDGSNDLVDFGNISSTAFAAEFTVALWFMPPATVGTQFMLSKGNASNDGLAIFTRATNNRVEVRIDAGTNAGADNQVIGGAWNYLVATRVAGTLTFWVNGVQAMTGGIATDGSNTTAFQLSPAAAPWSGRLTDLRVCGSRGVSASEAAGWYDQARRGHPDLLRRYTPRVWLAGGAGGGGGGGDVTVTLTGSAVTGSAGTLGPTLAVGLTGTSSTSTAGSLSPATTVSLTGTAATGAAGSLTPGIAVTLSGTSLTGSAGTLTPGSAIALSGSALTSATGTLTPSITVALTGTQVVVSAGTITPQGDVTVSLTGIAVTTSTGTLGPVVAVNLTGTAVTSGLGTLGVSVAVGLLGTSVVFSAGTLTSSGGLLFIGPACGTVTLTSLVGGTVTLTSRVGGTVSLEGC